MSDALLSHAVSRLEQIRSSPNAPCKICGGEARPFDVVDFNKSCVKPFYPMALCCIPVVYRLCSQCRFIFTDFGDDFSSEQWRTYVYNDDYIKVDPDYLNIRPRHNAREIITLLAGRKHKTIGLDYGGGNGRTTVLLRESGWAFDSYDPFGATDMSAHRIGHYNFCSAIEVFEHSPNPIELLSAILKLTASDRLIILVGTSTHDGFVTDEARLSWWYAAPRNGHISLHSVKSLQILGDKFGFSYVGDRGGTHLLTRGITRRQAQVLLVRGKCLRRVRSGLHLWAGVLA